MHSPATLEVMMLARPRDTFNGTGCAVGGKVVLGMLLEALTTKRTASPSSEATSISSPGSSSLSSTDS